MPMIYLKPKFWNTRTPNFFDHATGLWDLSSLTRDWPRPLAVKAPSPNHRTAREFLRASDSNVSAERTLGFIIIHFLMQFPRTCSGVNRSLYRLAFFLIDKFSLLIDKLINCTCIFVHSIQVNIYHIWRELFFFWGNS